MSNLTKREQLSALVDLAMNNNGNATMRPVIEKELLHYDILFALDKENLLDRLTFQGGTSLRLCYGAVRFSEDLDFAGGQDFSSSYLLNMKKCLEHYIGNRYGLEITVKEPKEAEKLKEYQCIKIDKWQISIVTSPEKKDLPKQRIKIEVGNIPAYSRVPRTLQENYDFLPDGYSDTLIMTESLDEIMADKLVAFVNCQKYIRHRDIWDLRWLKQRSAAVNSEFINAKLKDYSVDNYQEKLSERLNHLEGIINGRAFTDEMLRFLPVNVQERTLQNEGFKVYLITEIRELLLAVQDIVSV